MFAVPSITQGAKGWILAEMFQKLEVYSAELLLHCVQGIVWALILHICAKWVDVVWVVSGGGWDNFAWIEGNKKCSGDLFM